MTHPAMTTGTHTSPHPPDNQARRARSRARHTHCSHLAPYPGGLPVNRTADAKENAPRNTLLGCCLLVEHCCCLWMPHA